MSPASVNDEGTGKGERHSLLRGQARIQEWGDETEGLEPVLAVVCVVLGGGGVENHSSIASAAEMLMLIV